MNTLLTILKTSTNKHIYVDIDGTLLSSQLDTIFNNNYTNPDNTQQHKDTIIQWYRQLNYTTLSINYPLLIQLIILKYIFKYTLHIWTNRGQSNQPMTLTNLSIYQHIFTTQTYHAGTKINTTPNGIILDNEPKYININNNHNNILITF
ncbi:MAG: hypothetical protein KUG64_10760 [Cycloclasticus sp.]|nr:hypothetical protein [Cycloclasticus sp.]